LTSAAIARLPDTAAGVFLPLGLAMLLAAAAGVTVTISGNEMSLADARVRVAVGAIGLVLASWATWSLATKPSFTLLTAGVYPLSSGIPAKGGCPRDVRALVVLGARDGPGRVGLQLRAAPGGGVVVHNVKFEGEQQTSQTFGPYRIPVDRWLVSADRSQRQLLLALRTTSPTRLDIRTSVFATKRCQVVTSDE